MHIYVTRIECSKSKRSAIMGVGGLQTQTDSSWRIAFRSISLHDVRRCRCRCRKAILFWLLQLFIGAYAAPSALESKFICGKGSRMRTPKLLCNVIRDKSTIYLRLRWCLIATKLVAVGVQSKSRFHPVYGSSHSMICTTFTNHDILRSLSCDTKMANDKYFPQQEIFKCPTGLCFVTSVLATENECFSSDENVNYLIPTTTTER